jgi:hypothetical protein
MQEISKNQILCIVAGILIGIGLFQIYSIVPTAHKIDLPFPFEHTRTVREYEGMQIISQTIFHLMQH